MSSEKVKKEPPFRVVKREYVEAKQSFAVYLIAILIATAIIGVFITAITDMNLPTVYKTFFSASFSSGLRFKAFLQELALLLFVAVGLAPAFKMRFWNIGAQGQILVGGLVSAMLMYYIRDSWSSPLLITAVVVSSVLIAGLWCVIPAFFKVKFGSNETLFTLMMNYVAIQFVKYFTNIWKGKKSSFGVIDRFTGSRNGYFGSLFGIDVGWTLLLTLVFTLAMYFYMEKTKHGYEISVVGESLNTARYAGINDKKVILRTAFISGAVCGLVGMLNVTNISHTISTSTGSGNGFTAIIVAWLGDFNPGIMALISALLAFLSKGAGDIRNAAGLDDSISSVVVCVYLFVILGAGFFTRYKLVRNRKKEVSYTKTKVVEK